MTIATAVIGILGAILVGAMSPGPSFVVVARTAAARTRADGISAAIGMGVGGVVFAALALLGLHSLINQFTGLYAILKVAGGIYLLALAVALWRSHGESIAAAADAELVRRHGRSFTLGLTTQLSNPKTIVVYGSIFAALLPQDVPLWASATLLLGVFTIEAGWYGLVAVALSSARPRAAYLRWRRRVDRMTGTVLGALGLRLIVEGVSPRGGI
jgi:threonine/homoserine/homoserine lactone efflux protein